MSFIPMHIIILAIIIIIDYLSCKKMEKTSGRRKKMLLILTIAFNLCVLFIFKYFNFFNAKFAQLAIFLHWNYPISMLKLIVPLGISFFILKSLSYVFDVYNGIQKAENNLVIYSLYITFFPELPSGPIDRSHYLIRQLYETHDFNYDIITSGLKLMAWGFFKKLVIADRLAIVVNQIFSNLPNYSGFPLIIAVVFFTFQIYCDFSGYTDIAIGSGMILGFRLMKNFDKPYLSGSISEFWRKWHISLSSWLRDYLYLPIAYSISRKVRKPAFFGIKNESISYACAVLFTMLLAGLWHGAAWTFITWGLLMAVYMIFSIFTKKLRNKIARTAGLNKFSQIHSFLKVIITFSLLCIAWIFFRANNIQDALYIITHLFYNFNFRLSGNKLGMDIIESAFSLILIVLLILSETILNKYETIFDFIQHKPTWLRWTVYYVLIILILVFGEFEYNSFIYFQF